MNSVRNFVSAVVLALCSFSSFAQTDYEKIEIGSVLTTLLWLQALTSGVLPSFGAVLLNVHTTESTEDTWLHAARRAKR